MLINFMHDSNQFPLTRVKGFEKGKRESRKQKFNQNKRKESKSSSSRRIRRRRRKRLPP